MKRAAALAILFCFFLSGCSLFSLDEGERPPVHTVPSASDISEADPLTVTGTLTDDSGYVIAEYAAGVPQFNVAEGREDAFERINGFYRSEANAFKQDMQSFFEYVKRLSASKELSALSSVSSTYEVMPCDPKYVCVYRLYSMSQDGVVSSHPTAQLFLTDTGWRLTFKELFGENTEKALAILKEQLSEWCKENDMSDSFLQDINEAFLDNRFGLSDDCFFVCLDPFFVSAADPDCQVVRLPISPFGELFN